MYATHILLGRALWICCAIAYLHRIFNMCHTIIGTDRWIIKVAIPVWAIFGIHNTLRHAALITLNWMTVDYLDSADML